VESPIIMEVVILAVTVFWTKPIFICNWQYHALIGKVRNPCHPR